MEPYRTNPARTMIHIPAISSLINGQPDECINLQDRGLQYGDGLFETIRIDQGEPQYWSAHLRRLQLGCEKLNLMFPGENVLQADVASLVSTENSGTLKVVVTRGVGQRGYRAVDTQPSRIVSFYPQQSSPERFKTAHLCMCKHRLGINPALAGIKHLNRLEQVLARAEWEDEYDEGIMLDMEGRVIEGTMSNLFLVNDGVLITPELTRCGVAGIMREQILEKVKALNITLKIRDIQPAELRQADEMFLSNSIIGIWPVGTFEGHSMAIGSITESLMQSLGLPC